MTLDALIMSAGAFVALLPFLGFPNNWDRVLLLLAGLFIVGLGVVVRRRRGREETEARRRHIETSGPSEQTTVETSIES